MTLSEAIKQLQAFEEADFALGNAMSVMSIDGDTAAPRESYQGRARSMAYLGGLQFDLTTAPENIEAVQTILADPEADAVSRRKAEEIWERLEDLMVTPRDEYVAFEQLRTEAGTVWKDAKEKSDFAAFAPYLEKLLAFEKRLAQRKKPDKLPYDTLLDSFENGVSIASLDPFFHLLQTELTPVILAVKEKPGPDSSFLKQRFTIAQQREFSDRLMRLMGLDPARCTIAETEHPFTGGCTKWDVRITTHYHEDDVLASMYSVIHEGGHALYELGVADQWQFTELAGGSTMGIHESQSRFYENLIGRSLPFMQALLPLMRESFPGQLDRVGAEQLYRAANRAQPSLIRTEADELTYPMHVMIRYELEKALFADELTVKELPQAWNELYRRYLGVTVPNDRQGVLQDSHWSGGAFGYFPSYALGSAYGVQMLACMEREMDVWSAVAEGNLAPVTAWLGEHIHQYGRSKKPAELLRLAGVDPFRPQMYVDYLKTKFGGLYAL